MISQSKSNNRPLKIKLINYFKHILINFIQTLLDRNEMENYVLNLESGHCFQSKSKSHCICGLIESKNLKIFVDLNDLDPINIIDCEKNDLLKFIMLNKYPPILLDCYESKLNVFKITRDLISTILNIGVFIYNN